MCIYIYIYIHTSIHTYIHRGGRPDSRGARAGGGKSLANVDDLEQLHYHYYVLLLLLLLSLIIVLSLLSLLWGRAR